MLVSTFSDKSLRGGLALLIASIASIFSTSALCGQSDSGLGPSKTQQIELTSGWNAVYFEIQPLLTDPNELFEGTPIEVAAAYYRPATSMEFIDSPSELLGDRKSWSVWYAPEREDALLSNLYYLSAHTCYLLYSEEDYTFNLSGVSYFETAPWYPNAFNLVGFPVELTEQPTLANFFDGASSHDPLRIYTMVGGVWTLVEDPASALLEPGVAYWIYSDRSSQFSGPLAISFKNQSAGGIIFNPDVLLKDIKICNEASYPQNLTLSLEAGTAGLVPLEYVVTVLDGPNEPVERMAITMPTSMEIGPLEPGQAFNFSLQANQALVSEAVSTTNLVIVSDAGSRIEIPIVNIRNDLITE